MLTWKKLRFDSRDEKIDYTTSSYLVWKQITFDWSDRLPNSIYDWNSSSNENSELKAPMLHWLFEAKRLHWLIKAARLYSCWLNSTRKEKSNHTASRRSQDWNLPRASANHPCLAPPHCSKHPCEGGIGPLSILKLQARSLFTNHHRTSTLFLFT